MYKIAIKRPVATIIFALSLIFFGLVALKKIPKALFPNIDFPVILIHTAYPGASPLIVESKVTDKIEKAVIGIEGIKSLSSTSSRNISVVAIEFNLDKDINEAVNDVRDKVSNVSLDSNVLSPSIDKLGTNSAPIISVFLSSDLPDSVVMRHANDVVVSMLQRINGVGNVKLIGYRERQINIFPDLSLMNKYNLTFNELDGIVKSSNIDLDGGRVISKSTDMGILVSGTGKNIKDIENIVVKNGIRLKDIAKVEDDLKEEKVYSSYNGKQGIIFEIQKIAGANSIKIAKDVYGLIDSIKEVSPGYEIEVFRDTTKYIEDSIQHIEFDLILGAFLAVLVVFLFLRNFMITIVSAISIPISLLTTVTIIYLIGYTINMLTLVALTLSIGIIIDDAIVVIENIHRKLETGMGKLQASYEGVKEISFAIISISAMLLSVFIPLGTMDGMVGKFFSSFGITIAIAVVVSYIVVITIIPMFSSLLINSKHSKFYYFTLPFFNGLENIYSRIIGFCTGTWKMMIFIVMIFTGIFIFSLKVAFTLGSEFILKEDISQLAISIQADPGTSISKIKKVAVLAEHYIKNNKHVKYTSLQINSGTEATIFVMLNDIEKRKEPGSGQFELMDKMFNDISSMSELKEYSVRASPISTVGPPDSAPFQAIIYSTFSAVNLEKSAENLKSFLENKFGNNIHSIRVVMSEDEPGFTIKPLKNNLSYFGISSLDIANAISNAFSDSINISYYKEEGKEYDIAMRLIDSQRVSKDELKKLQVRTKSGDLVFLDGLIEIEEQQSKSSIKRYQAQRSITVLATPASNSVFSLGDIVSDVKKNSDKWLISGVNYRLSGDAEITDESNAAFVTAITIAFILIYLILATLYESFLQPLIIMITMPFSFSGAFFLTKIIGIPISIFSTMGLILLIGLVGKSATLLVDVANDLRSKGVDMIDAIRIAGKKRLRPILMTTIAMVIGMLPLALSYGQGSAMKMPIGITMVGGLLFSMFLSLLIVPIFYRIIAPLDDKLKKLYTNEEKLNF